MGILRYIHSATNTYRSFCSYGWSTFASIGAAVRINVNNLVFRRVRVPGGVRANDNDIGDSVTQKTPDLMLPVADDSIPVNANNMGIEDSVTLKNLDLPLTLEDISNDVDAETNSPVKDKVGVWGYISSAIGAVKQKIVDFFKRSCKYGWFAVKKVGNAVRVDGAGKLKNYVRDKEVQSYLAEVAIKIAKDVRDKEVLYYLAEVAIKIAKDVLSAAIRKQVRCVLGGPPVYKIFPRSLKSGGNKKCDDKKLEDKDEKIKELCERIEKLEKQSRDSSCSKLHERTEIQSPDLELKSSKTNHFDIASNQSPEDVIGVFMMKEFIGTRFLDDLIVPKVGNTNKT